MLNPDTCGIRGQILTLMDLVGNTSGVRDSHPGGIRGQKCGIRGRIPTLVGFNRGQTLTLIDLGGNTSGFRDSRAGGIRRQVV